MERMDAQLRGHTETSGQRMEPDLEGLMSLPSVPYEACDRQPGRVSSLSMARYKTNDCGRCSGGNSQLSAALPEARTKRSGSSLTSCRFCLVRLRSRAASYRWGSFASVTSQDTFSSVRTVRSAVRTSRTSVRRACSRGVGHRLWHA